MNKTTINTLYNPKIEIAVMAHPKRKKLLPRLTKALGNVPVAIDYGLGIWENRKKAMMMTMGGDYSLVIQDDAIIGKNFLQRAQKEIKKYPEHAHCFYFGKRNNKEMMDIAKKGCKNGGVELKKLAWGVAICLPTKIIPQLINFCDKMDILHDNDDTRISKFLEKFKIKIWYPLPSIVDHRWDEESLMGNCEGVKKRQAYKFVGI